MFFGLLAPRFLLYSVYVLWFTCSQILAIFCLCSLIYLLPDFSYILFISLVYLLPDFGYILLLLFGLFFPRFLLYSVCALWFTSSQICYILFMLFGLLAPRFWLFSVYALWFTCSHILAIFCLCSLVYLFPDFR